MRRNRPVSRRLILGPIYASRSVGRATVKLIRSVGRIRVPASQRTRVPGKDGSGPGRLRTLRNRGVATIRHSITTTGGLPARAVRKITRRAGRGRDLAGAVRPSAATGGLVDRGHTARSGTRTAITSIGRTAERREKEGERAAPTAQAQAESKAKARATTRRSRQRRATSQQGKPEQARRTQDLEQHTVRELREQVKKAGIKRRSSMTKEQLIKALRNHR